MTAVNYKYKYGHGYKTFSVEQEHVLDEIKIAQFPPLENLKEAVLEALYHPIDCAPIDELVKPGMKIAFICNDSTRVANTHAFLPILVDEMNKLGVPDADMRIIFALGTHRAMSYAEKVEQVSENVANRLPMYDTDCNNIDEFEYFGDTSFGTPVWLNKKICDVDLVIMTGAIVYHFFSGFGGGRKAVLPGVAAMETVRRNHSLMMSPASQLGKLHGNPVYDDQMEGVRIFAKEHKLFLFNVVLDAQKQFLKIFAGNWDTAHVEACKFVEQVYGAPINEPADIVIASCGGYPKDINVYQLQKTMDNAWCAVKEGGVVIILGECEEGSGSAALEQALEEHPSPDAIREHLAQNFVIGAHKAFAITRLMKKAKFILVSALDKNLAQKLLFEAVDDVDEAITLAKKYVGDDYKILLMPQGSLTVPVLIK